MLPAFDLSGFFIAKNNNGIRHLLVSFVAPILGTTKEKRPTANRWSDSSCLDGDSAISVNYFGLHQ
jgi:hypothetical protein